MDEKESKQYVKRINALVDELHQKEVDEWTSSDDKYSISYNSQWGSFLVTLKGCYTPDPKKQPPVTEEVILTLFSGATPVIECTSEGTSHPEVRELYMSTQRRFEKLLYGKDSSSEHTPAGKRHIAEHKLKAEESLEELDKLLGV